MKKKGIRNFLLLTTIAAGSIHLLNRFIDTTSQMKNMLKADDGDFYHWKNGNIYYKKCGEGSPLLLIHGLSPINSSYEWCRLEKKLEKDHTVYMLDLPGCGRSEKPCLTYTNYFYVQLITDFIKNVIGTSPDVITTNNSVSFVVQAAGIDKNLIKRILCINPPAVENFNRSSNGFLNLKSFMLKLPIIGTLIYNIETTESSIRKTLQETYFHKPQLVSSKMIDTYYEAAHKEKSHGRYLLASLMGHYLDNAIEHSLKTSEVPMYIIESNQLPDAVTVTSSYKKINTKIQTFYLSDTGAVPQLEAPDSLFHIITQIL